MPRVRFLYPGLTVSSFLNSRHHDTAAPPRSRPAADHDIHIAVQRGQKIHQAFDGKALQLEAVSQMNFVG
jgi:hypothetical protein